MKTYCKHSRITEPAFVRDCIERFLNGKRSRRDVNDFLSRHPDLDSLSWQIADEIGRGEYRFAPIRYFRRVEPISGKIRVIGRESIRHQIYDYVCGTALMPLFRAKVGRWQTASVGGRGIADARRSFRRYALNPTSLRLAYRCASYYGWLKNSDSIQYRRRNNVDQIVRRARNTVAASRKKG